MPRGMMEAMGARIDVRYTIPDTRAEVARKHFARLGLKGDVRAVGVTDSYVVDADMTARELSLAARLFEAPLVEQATVDEPQSPDKFDWAIEVGFLPGVTDNVGNTARETIEDFLGRKFKDGEAVYSSQVVFVSGDLTEKDAEVISDSLYNPVIERAEIKSFEEFQRDGGMGAHVPKVVLRERGEADAVDLEVSDKELTRIGKEGIADKDGGRRGPLALDLDAMNAIREYFRREGRNPTDVELESIAQTWSEHCKHTIFSDPLDDIEDGIFRTYIKGATDRIRKEKAHSTSSGQGDDDFCVSVFTDNSGAIGFDDEYLITHKVETHNTPSALDPFGGAITGIVGVNRDTLGFGLGAKPIINLYGYCFAAPDDETVLYRDKEKTQKMLSARRIMEGVIEGVNTGGNCSGIPTPQGFMLFDSRYRGKPLVFVGTVGLIPRTVAGKPSHVKKAEPGDYIVMTGGRVGRDGIHGATFSSEALDPQSPATAVQIGDPITQKKMSDALVKEARDKGLYHSITDNGAGGLSCSVSEMARECNGCRVELDKVPLKYPGLSPWQIWISESQERMTLAVPKEKWDELSALMERRGVEATIIGEFTDSGKCVVTWKVDTVMDVDLSFLHDGKPQAHRKTARPQRKKENTLLFEGRDFGSDIHKMLARPNLASFEFISRQYDHEVQGGSVIKPLQGKGQVNGDATVHRPLLHSKKGVILSSGILPWYAELDSYRMAASVVDSAVRAAVAGGADLAQLALLDNFCWCSSDSPERLFQLKEAVRACHDYAVIYGTPLISGKDSMFNDFKGYDEEGSATKISVLPTLLISAIGVMDDAEQAVSLDAKEPGDLVYMLGETANELGGSEYALYLGSIGSGEVPQVDGEKNKELYEALSGAIRERRVASAISVGRGGIAVALAKTAMGGKRGMKVSLTELPGSFSGDASALFSESQGRVVVTVAPQDREKFEECMKGKAYACIGEITGQDKIEIEGREGSVELSVPDALESYRGTFRGY